MTIDYRVFLDYEKFASFVRTLIESVTSLARVRIYSEDFMRGSTNLTVSNCSYSISTDGETAFLDVLIPAGNTGYVETPLLPVSPGQTMMFSFSHKEDDNVSSLKLIVVWYKKNGRENSREELGLPVSSTWSDASMTLVVPDNSAYVGLRMEATAGGSDAHVYIDTMTIDLIGYIFRVDELGDIVVSLKQPTAVYSRHVSFDNSSGSVDFVSPLFSDPVPSRRAVLKRDVNDSGDVYIGDSSSQEYPLSPGEVCELTVSDLSAVYVRVPPGVTANIYVLYEV